MICTTSLYSHQATAAEKLLRPRVGALFMEMGTGKSLTAIEMAVRRQQRISNVVWFCPVSLKLTARAEILKHTDCDESDIYVFDDKTAQGQIPHATWYIVGIESVSGSDRAYLAVNDLVNKSSFVVVDESGYIKGHSAKRTVRITKMAQRARYRLILTGTPLTQGLVDLYAQMRFLSPAILGYHSFYSFSRNHLEYSEKFPGMITRTLKEDVIAEKIKPYVYQVTKAECLDLPPKIHRQRWCGLTEQQAELYYQAKCEILEELYDDDISSIVIFRLFTALQQIACGFWNRNGELIEIENHRIATLLYSVAASPDDKIVIWSKYHYNIGQIVIALRSAYGHDSVAQYHGKLSESERAAQLEIFRHSARFLVATQATGGHGLTLNESVHHIFFSNGFKYSERIQAEDRSHRIGQTESVLYTDIVADCGIDQRIQKALASKQDVVEAFRREVENVKEQKGKLKSL